MSTTTTKPGIGVDVDQAKARIANSPDLNDARLLANAILNELVQTRQYLTGLYDSGRVAPTPAALEPGSVTLNQLAASQGVPLDQLIQVAVDQPRDVLHELAHAALTGATVLDKDLAETLATSIVPWMKHQDEQGRQTEDNS